MNASHRFYKIFSIVFVLSVSVTSGIAYAQLLEEIIVTAQKREQRLQDVGLSVTAFSGNQIRELAYTNSIDIGQQTPGLQITQLHASTTQLNIRGVSQNDFAVHLEGPIATYVDNAYSSSMGTAHAQIFDLERVEVLRGPQGTLFGRNATGGLLHFLSKRPTEEWEGYGEFTYGSYDQIKFEGAVGGPLSDRLRGRISFATNNHDGIMENRIGPDLRDAETYSVRGQLEFDVTDKFQAYVKLAYSEDDSRGNTYTHSPSTFITASGLGELITDTGQPPLFLSLFDPLDGMTDLILGPCSGCDAFGYREPDDDPHTGSFDFIPTFVRDIFNAQLELTWDLENFTVTSITDYLNVDRTYGEDTDGSPFDQVTFVDVEDRDQISQEIRLNGETDKFTWVAGAYYLDFDVFSVGTVTQDAGPLTTFGFDGSMGAVAGPFTFPPAPTGPFPPFAGLPFDHTGTTKSTSWAIFGHVETKLSEQFSLVTALRYTEDDRDMDLTIDNRQLFMSPFAIVSLDPSNSPFASLEFENVSAKIQLDWTPNEDWLLYAGFTRGHKAGNFSQPFFIPADLSELPHDEEVLHSFDIGAKGVMLDGRLGLNASIFYYDYKDYQAFSFENLAQKVNNFDANVLGAEIELVFNPVDALDLAFGVSLLDTEVEDVGTPIGVLDRELPFAPDVSFNGLARYTWPIFGGNLSAQVDFNYVDDFCFGVICHPLEEEDSYIVANTRLSYTTDDERWRLAAFVKNVGDEEYRKAAVESSFAGFSSVVFSDPRWYGGSIAYQWK